MFSIAIAVVVVLAGALPAVSAYESHMINVTARVEERFNVFKVMRLAEDWEIQEAIDAGVNLPPGPCNPEGVTEPGYVPIETCVVWVVTIMVMNPHDYPINNVTVKDNFSAEVGASGDETLPYDLDFKEHSRGKSNKEPFITQYRITWYVTYVSGNVEDPEDPLDPLDNSGEMLPGDSEYLVLLVWTKLNPSGRQEYTTPGTYTLNSGPTAKWLDPDGHQFSSEGDSLYVVAYDPNPP